MVKENNTLSLVQQEIQNQDKKWGVQNHTILEWNAILGEEFGEASQAAVETHFRGQSVEALLSELVQVAAVAIQAHASITRNAYA